MLSCLPSSDTVIRKIYIILYKLTKLSCAANFIAPVSLIQNPDYLQKITTPIDLSTMINKLKKGKYHQIEEIHSDLMLISRNCYNYNRGSLTQTFFKEKIRRFSQSVQCAWQGLIKQVGTSQLRFQSNRVREIIEEVEYEIINKLTRKLERLEKGAISTRTSKSDVSSKSQKLINSHIKQPYQIFYYQNPVFEKKDQQDSNQESVYIGGVNNLEPEQSVQKQIKNAQNFQIVINKDQSYCQLKTLKKLKINLKDSQKYQKINPLEQNFTGTYQQCKQEQDSTPAELFNEELNEETISIEKCQTIRRQEEISQNKKQIMKINQQMNLVSGSGSGVRDLKSQVSSIIKKKLKKFRRILQEGLEWIVVHIFKGEQLEQDLNQVESDWKLQHDQLKGMRTFSYLQQFINSQRNYISKGQINLKKLLKMFKQIDFWLKMLSGSYLNWPSKYKYVEVQQYLIKSIQKIIEYKKLGPEFEKVLQQHKTEILPPPKTGITKDILFQAIYTKALEKYPNSRRQSSRLAEKQTVKYQQVLKNLSICHLKNREQIKNMQLKSLYIIDHQELSNKFKISHEIQQLGTKKSEHEQFLNLLEIDQFYCNFRVLIVRDKEKGLKLKFKDNKQLQQNNKPNIETKSQYSETFQNERKDIGKEYKSDIPQREDCEQQNTKSNDKSEYLPYFIEKERKGRRKLGKRRMFDQRKNSISQIESMDIEEFKKDEQILHWYSLRSNRLIVEKYNTRLQLNWQKKKESIFGPVPNKLTLAL